MNTYDIEYLSPNTLTSAPEALVITRISSVFWFTKPIGQNSLQSNTRTIVDCKHRCNNASLLCGELLHISGKSSGQFCSYGCPWQTESFPIIIRIPSISNVRCVSIDICRYLLTFLVRNLIIAGEFDNSHSHWCPVSDNSPNNIMLQFVCDICRLYVPAYPKIRPRRVGVMQILHGMGWAGNKMSAVRQSWINFGISTVTH